VIYIIAQSQSGQPRALVLGAKPTQSTFRNLPLEWIREAAVAGGAILGCGVVAGVGRGRGLHRRANLVIGPAQTKTQTKRADLRSNWL
jgi:hypothetical protein